MSTLRCAKPRVAPKQIALSVKLVTKMFVCRVETSYFTREIVLILALKIGSLMEQGDASHLEIKIVRMEHNNATGIAVEQLVLLVRLRAVIAKRIIPTLA